MWEDILHLKIAYFLKKILFGYLKWVNVTFLVYFGTQSHLIVQNKKV